jgi:hypothetical protein
MERGPIKTPVDANLQPCCQTCPYHTNRPSKCHFASKSLGDAAFFVPRKRTACVDHPDFNTNTEEV